MNPIVILWPSFTDNEAVIVSANAVTVGVPLTLIANTFLPDSSVGVQGVVPGNLVPPYADSPRYGLMPNLGTGAQVPAYNMPMGNVRSVSITAAAGSLGTTQFQVIGLDENGYVISVTGTPATVDNTFFKTIISIIPQATLADGNTVQVGLGADGFTQVLRLDTWNKNNNYSIGYAVFESSVSLTPYYTLSPITNANTSMYSDPAIWYALPISNPNIITSPSSITTLPVVTNVAFSVVGIPLTSLSTKVAASTGGFYQTIIQQGGLV